MTDFINTSELDSTAFYIKDEVGYFIGVVLIWLEGEVRVVNSWPTSSKEEVFERFLLVNGVAL